LVLFILRDWFPSHTTFHCKQLSSRVTYSLLQSLPLTCYEAFFDDASASWGNNHLRRRASFIQSSVRVTLSQWWAALILFTSYLTSSQCALGFTCLYRLAVASGHCSVALTLLFSAANGESRVFAHCSWLTIYNGVFQPSFVLRM